MNNQELKQNRENLRQKTDRVKGLHPMVAAGEMKAAAVLMAEITSELARRELNRGSE